MLDPQWNNPYQYFWEFLPSQAVGGREGEPTRERGRTVGAREGGGKVGKLIQFPERIIKVGGDKRIKNNVYQCLSALCIRS